MGLHLDDYHDAVIEKISTDMPWLTSVDNYPEQLGKLDTPCAFFGVVDWDRASDQRMTGELSIELSCQLLIVFGQEGEVSSKAVRNASMFASIKIDENRFGLNAEPAQFVSAEPWAFDPDLDQYVVWAVNFRHEIEVGEDQFDLVPDFLPTDVNVAQAPKNGADHLDDYEQLENE